MEEHHLDGNGLAGLLAELDAAESTSVLRTCQACGDHRALGEHRAFRSAGVVLRCPSCAEIAAVVAVRDDRLLVQWRGRYEVDRLTSGRRRDPTSVR